MSRLRAQLLEGTPSNVLGSESPVECSFQPAEPTGDDRETEHSAAGYRPVAEFLTLAELAKWLRCSTRTVQRLISVGDGPPLIHLSDRRLIFSIADARLWLARRTKGNTLATEPPRRSRQRPRTGGVVS